jgi:hypothetical protein
MQMNASVGVIGGTPTAAGVSTITLTATNSYGSSSAVLSLTVNAAPSILTTLLPAAVVGTAYSQTLSASGSNPITWSVTGGALPSGLTLNASSGVISGTPAAAGTASFTVNATNAYGNTSQLLSLTANAAISVSLAPGTTTLTISQSQQLKATVSGSSNTAITWSLAPAIGSISSSGLYTAPASIATAQTVVVTANSVADSTRSATAMVTLKPVAVSLTPATVSLTPSQNQTFTASVSGTANTTVTWSLSQNLGGYASTATSLTYVAQSTAATAQTVTITATSSADTSKIATAVVTLPQTVTVSVNPSSANLTTSGTEQLTATVLGTSNTAVIWSINPSVGTISSTGLYTAPATVPSPAAVTITATSVSSPSTSASATIALVMSAGTTYYIAPSVAGGNDANNGLSPDAPWLSPKHSGLVCNSDTIIAAPGTYSAANFGIYSWGTVTCPSGQGIVWLRCSTFDTCRMTAQPQPVDGIAIGASYWGVQGWEVDGTAASGPCFFAYPNGSATIHHLVFANDIASGCGLNGFDASNAGGAGVDYFAVVGSIAYNSAGGESWCGSGISIYQPVQSDFLPGTHIYVAGNFSYGNLNGNPCGGGTPTDGEGIILDTFDGSQGHLPAPYSAQAVVDNNILVANGGRGVGVFNNTAGSSHATIYIRRNTTWGNNKGVDADCGGCGELSIDMASNVVALNNLIQNTTDYALSAVNLSDLTNEIYANFAYSAAGQNSFLYNTGLFAFGPNNTFNADPLFAHPANPGAPNCAGYSSVPACMATLIANFTPTNSIAVSYGYQMPSPAPAYDALFPKWLCSAHLPAGLVTNGCE